MAISTTHDIVPDSPTNTFATINTLNSIASGATVSDGNLNLSNTLANQTGIVNNLAIPKSGRWYFEIIINSTGQTRVQLLENTSTIPTIYSGLGVSISSSSSGNRTWYITSASWGGESTSHRTDRATPDYDIIRFFYDADNGNLWIGHNANWLDDTATTNSNSNPSTNAQPTLSSISSADYLLYLNVYQNNIVVNFGQDSSFGGNKTSGSADASDAKGIGSFYYSPPTGALALCTANLPSAPDLPIDPAVDDLPEDYFKAVIYNGDETQNGMYGVSTYGVSKDIGFQPDLIWGKARSIAYNHIIIDSLRPHSDPNSYYRLHPDLTNAEADYNDNIYITSNGFNCAARQSGVNENSQTFVAWCWKAGGNENTYNWGDGTGSSTYSGIQSALSLPASSTSGMITPSGMSVNQKAGFSIVKYTASTSIATLPHGLSKNPELMIFKNLDTSSNWDVITDILSGSLQYLWLNSTNGVNNTGWGSAPTNQVMSVYNYNANMIAYCWHSVEGYSAFGSYEGNASTDGPFVYTGFKPAWVMIKNIDTTSSTFSSWGMYDNARNPYNVLPASNLLWANKSASEGKRGDGTTTNGLVGPLDFLSNGFKVRSTACDEFNTNVTYIYAAFAEQPFKYANAR